ncbi:hypothetical protein HDU97_003688 [Phlyctochytrium planicorne]|nr:hypothetical protein HDU97_003688 [Phlyctochytrium planicorne]
MSAPSLDPNDPEVRRLLRHLLGLRPIYLNVDEDEEDAEMEADDVLDDDGEEGWETTSEATMPPEKDEGNENRSAQKLWESETEIFNALRHRELSSMHSSLNVMWKHFIPKGKGTVLHNFKSKPYCGQFSSDGSLFYSATQDFEIHLYDGVNDLQPKSVIKAISGSWTITDCDLSQDNERLIYSSIHERVYMANLDPLSENYGNHHQLDFLATEDDDNFGIWSIRLSSDGKEVVAGANNGQIFVYDLVKDVRVHSIKGHYDDVNAVCFADDSSNIVVSGSDDSFLKVWDRRSLRKDSKPSGVLVGHTEGVTFVSSKKDGRYLLSNGKDQKMLYWDMRKMLEPNAAAPILRTDYSRNFDYRWEMYPGKPSKHPKDISVRQFLGHSVLRTLIRCHFSPDSTGHKQMTEHVQSRFWNHLTSSGTPFVETLFIRSSAVGILISLVREMFHGILQSLASWRPLG